MLEDNGVYMSDNPYNFNSYYERLAVLSERLKPTKSAGYVSNIQGLLIYFVLIGPLFINNDLLLFAQQTFVWLMVLTVFTLIFSIDENTVKVNTTNWLKSKNYNNILICILCERTFKGIKKALFDVLSYVFIITISYIVYKMNLLYFNYMLSFFFLLFSFALKNYTITQGLFEYKEILRNCLKQENKDIEDIVPEAEEWIINRKVND